MIFKFKVWTSWLSWRFGYFGLRICGIHVVGGAMGTQWQVGCTSKIVKIDARALHTRIYVCNWFAYACVFCRMAETVSRRVFDRLGGTPYSWNRHQPLAGHVTGNVCKFWLAGTCTRNPCRFLHPDRVAPTKSVMASNNLKVKQQPQNSLKPLRDITKRANEKQILRKTRQRTSPDNEVYNKQSLTCNDRGTSKPFVQQSDVVSTQKPFVKRGDVGSNEKPSDKQKVVSSVKHIDRTDSGAHKSSATQNYVNPQKVQHKICEDSISKNCVDGEKSKSLHSWSSSNEFSKLAQLEGHQKAATGINLPSDTDKLFTSSEDGTVRMWNCHTGECMVVANMGAPVWCLESEGPWVFAGITNAVKAWNIKTQTELTLDAPAGQVYSLAFSDGILFAGLENGSICRWKLNSDDISFEGPLLLNGHTNAVVSLFWGANLLYSGSLDKTVKVWDRKTLCCVGTLDNHSDVVMSVLCWEKYLLTSSLDKTLKVWAATETGELEVTYTRNEEHGIISLNGMHDTAGNPLLLCSLSDNSVRIYDLPSFKERGRIFAKEQVKAIHVGPGGLFFTGDRTGVVSVWRYSGDSGSLDNVAAA